MCSSDLKIPAHGTKSSVEFLAVIAARISQREAPLGLQLGIAATNPAIRHRDVLLLDDDVRHAIAPECVPGPKVFSQEPSFDARPAQRASHRAVELTAPPERDRTGARAEIRDDPGEDFVALLPILTDDVEVEP